MRERVALHSGSLDAGARPDGGFTVRARLPLTRGSGVSGVRDRLARAGPPRRRLDPRARGDRRDRADLLAQPPASPPRSDRHRDRGRSVRGADRCASRLAGRRAGVLDGGGHGLDAVRRSAALQRQRVRDSAAGARLFRGRVARHAAERACVESRLGAALGVGAPAGPGRIDDRVGQTAVALFYVTVLLVPPGWSAALSADTAPGPALSVSLRRRPPPSRTRTMRRRSRMSGRASAQSSRTSSLTASARW